MIDSDKTPAALIEYVKNCERRNPNHESRTGNSEFFAGILKWLKDYMQLQKLAGPTNEGIATFISILSQLGFNSDNEACQIVQQRLDTPIIHSDDFSKVLNRENLLLFVAFGLLTQADIESFFRY